MILENSIDGKFVNLRSVREEDAEFILRLRNNPQISKFLPPLNVSIDQQKAWIAKQRLDNDSYYFIIEDKGFNPIGTISVYNIDGDHAETGRFCSTGDSVQNMEAAVLNDDFIFQTLKLEYLDIWVYKDNKPVLALNQGFGCKWDGEGSDEKGIPFLYGKLTSENYMIKSQKIKKTLKRIQNNGN